MHTCDIVDWALTVKATATKAKPGQEKVVSGKRANVDSRLHSADTGYVCTVLFVICLLKKAYACAVRHWEAPYFRFINGGHTILARADILFFAFSVAGTLFFAFSLAIRLLFPCIHEIFV